MPGAEDLSEAIPDGLDNSEPAVDAVEEEIAGQIGDETPADPEQGKTLDPLTLL